MNSIVFFGFLFVIMLFGIIGMNESLVDSAHGTAESEFDTEKCDEIDEVWISNNSGYVGCSKIIQLDEDIYSWNDKVYVIVISPEHNLDDTIIEKITDSSINVSTNNFSIKNYQLEESTPDSGIFVGEIMLTGFPHDATGDGKSKATYQSTSSDGSGPYSVYLQTEREDELVIEFKMSDEKTILEFAPIRWNIGEVQWLEARYPSSGTGVVRVIDPDMNLDPEAVDNFDVEVWSDSDVRGIDLTVTETNEATGIFEGTVFFRTDSDLSGHLLRVAEGDTVTAEYEDNTLPNPYTTTDELDITATSLIGIVIPPLGHTPAPNLRIVDEFGNSLDTVAILQPIQISQDLANGSDEIQHFTNFVQIRDDVGKVVFLTWSAGSLSPGQAFSSALPWTPTESGLYTVTSFVWDYGDDGIEPLQPPISTTMHVK